MNRPLYLGTAVLLCILALAGVVTVLIADSDLANIALGYTAAAILFFGTVVGLTVSMSGRFAWVGGLASLVAVAAFGSFMGYLWAIKFGYYNNETTGKLAACFTLFAFALAYAGFVLNGLRAGDPRQIAALTVMTVVGAVVLAALLSVAIVGDAMDVTYFRVVAVISVVWALGMAVIPVLRRLHQST